jgi:hypothetical protein
MFINFDLSSVMNMNPVEINRIHIESVSIHFSCLKTFVDVLRDEFYAFL